MCFFGRDRVSFRSLEGWPVVQVQGLHVQAVCAASEVESDAMHVLRSAVEYAFRSAVEHVNSLPGHVCRTVLPGHVRRTVLQGHAHRSVCVKGNRFQAVHARRSLQSSTVTA